MKLTPAAINLLVDAAARGDVAERIARANDMRFACVASEKDFADYIGKMKRAAQ